jgi:adenosylcobyric acid synthase
LNAKLLMIQGTSSGAGKSTLVTAFCRTFSDMGYKVSPFKAQNMTSNFYPISNSKRVAAIQAIQAFASRRKPDILMNPILLEPLGDFRSNIFVDGNLYGQMTAAEYYQNFVLEEGFYKVLKSLATLRQGNDIIVIEGAGSPAEINITEYDIANMVLAEKVCAPVILTADIERGGCFASIVGTMQLLKPHHRELIKGVIINKFRGDKQLLLKAIKSVEQITKKEILGVIPWIKFALPPEDSLDEVKDYPQLEMSELLDKQVNNLAIGLRENIDMKGIVSGLLKIERN